MTTPRTSTPATESVPPAASAPARYGVTGIPFVDAVRSAHIQHARRSGSQQHRLRYHGECWLVSLHRWINEQVRAGATRDDVLATLRGVVVQAQADLEARGLTGCPIAAIEVVARDEILAGAHDDLATHDAMRHPTADSLRRAAALAAAQIVALEKKIHAFTVAAFRLVQFGTTHRED